jgi:hypothetical protein
MKYVAIFSFVIALTLNLQIASAQSPSTPESAEAAVNWRNLQESVSRLVQADNARAAAIQDYWAKYVAGLSAHK